jgi:hypothetical protein
MLKRQSSDLFKIFPCLDYREQFKRSIPVTQSAVEIAELGAGIILGEFKIKNLQEGGISLKTLPDSVNPLC